MALNFSCPTTSNERREASDTTQWSVHGTPTVAFNCGGVSDAVAEGVNGALVAAGDYAGFGNAITFVVQADMRESASEFASQFSWDSYCAQVEQGIERVSVAHRRRRY